MLFFTNFYVWRNNFKIATSFIVIRQSTKLNGFVVTFVAAEIQSIDLLSARVWERKNRSLENCLQKKTRSNATFQQISTYFEIPNSALTSTDVESSRFYFRLVCNYWSANIFIFRRIRFFRFCPLLFFSFFYLPWPHSILTKCWDMWMSIGWEKLRKKQFVKCLCRRRKCELKMLSNETSGKNIWHVFLRHTICVCVCVLSRNIRL